MNEVVSNRLKAGLQAASPHQREDEAGSLPHEAVADEGEEVGVGAPLQKLDLVPQLVKVAVRL